MIDPLEYLFLGLLVFIVNLVPAFMPPTWSILTFFTVKYDLLIIPTVIVGAVAAVSGRIVLYYLATRYFRRFLSPSSKKNFEALRAYLLKHERFSLPFILAYAFSPIPSNQLFITAGLIRFNIKLLSFSFYVGRLVSYSFWVGLATTLAGSLEELFASRFLKIGSLGIEVVGFALIILMAKINWRKVLTRGNQD
ncbi:MAG: hypothetical protein Q8Q15_03765 [bacterium]|nr:hypothetical protein [bacterium]